MPPRSQRARITVIILIETFFPFRRPPARRVEGGL